MTGTAPPRSDLATRAIAGAAMIAVAVAAVYLGGWPLRILVVAAAALMLAEWGAMHRLPRWGVAAGIVFLALNLLLLPEYLFPSAQFAGEPAREVWHGFAIAAAIACALGLAARCARLAGGYLYVALPTYALLLLNWLSWEAVFWAMLVTWATDIFAYFAGRAIGGPKLAPRVSPNKTWAGLAGGMAGAAATGALAAWAFGLPAIFLVLGAPMGLIAQAGDLYESALKRRAGVKDSGTLLPGHGGVLDRLDGLLPVVLATLAVVAAGHWGA